MSRQHQNPNYHYQTPYQNSAQQPGQYLQPLPNTYNDRQGQQAYSSYPEGSLQPQPSGQRHGSRSPHAGTVPFPEPQRGSSASHQHAYIDPSRTTPNLTVPTHQQHGRRSSHGHSPSIGSSSLYSAGASSDTGGSSNFYSQPGVQPHHGGGYTATAAQSQDWDAAVYDGAQGHGPWSTSAGVPPASVGSHGQSQFENAARYDEEHNTRSKAPGQRPANTHRPLCRYPRCTRLTFFDRRVNELREWCGDQHMQAAIMDRVEKPCNTCRVWPRLYSYKHCSGNVCRYPGY